MTLKIDDLKWRFTPSLWELYYLAAGGVLVLWYAWLMDDAYVYFRYVDNFIIHDNGLVWNPGEYVEGFSSPFWAILVSLLRAAHLDYWVIVRLIGVICYIGFWWLACLINRGLSDQSFTRTTQLNFPLLYLSHTYGISCYFTSGLEAPVVQLLAAAFGASILWPRSRALQLLVGIAPLVRHELVLPYLLFLGYSKFLRGRLPLLAIVTGACSLGSYGLFRVWYYADLFPNTFYLKNIIWVSQGLNYLKDTMGPYHVALYFGFMSLVYAALRWYGPRRCVMSIERVAMLAISLPIVLYVIKIGGGPRHFRYLAFPFILSILATGGLMEQIAIPSARGKSVIAVVLGLFAISNYPNQLPGHPFFLSEGFDHQTIALIKDSAWHRHSEDGLTPSELFGDTVLSYQAAKERYASESRSPNYVPISPRMPQAYARPTQSNAKVSGSALIADYWCQTSYLHAALPSVHSLGLTEAFLARVEMPSERPAHKFGLVSLANDLLVIRAYYGFRPGAFDDAVLAERRTLPWVSENIHTLRKIEQKVYNRHNFLDNFMLALHPVPKIKLDPISKE